MKKLLVFIGLFAMLVCEAQDIERWVVSSQGKNDTIAYDKRGGSNFNWLGATVMVNITIWNVEDIDGAFYFGGYDNTATIQSGKQSWNYYSTDYLGVDIGPLVADTSGTYFTPNYDTTRYNFTGIISDFAFEKPAFRYDKNNTDSTNYVVIFKGTKIR